MRKLLGAIVGSAALMAPSAAFATTWLYNDVVGDGHNRRIYLISLERTVRIGDEANVWLKLIHEHPQTDGSKYEIERWVFKCGMAKAALLSYVDYYANGSVGDSQAVDRPARIADYSDVVPDSVNEDIYQKVCSGKFRTLDSVKDDYLNQFVNSNNWDELFSP